MNLGAPYEPIRNTDIGKTFCVWDSTPHSFMKKGVALLGKALPIVLFIIVNMVITRMNVFLDCRAVRFSCF